MTETLADFVRYGYIALPLWVFAEQLGVPIPAAPILLAAARIASPGSNEPVFPRRIGPRRGTCRRSDLVSRRVRARLAGALADCVGCAWSQIRASVASRILWRNMGCVRS